MMEKKKSWKNCKKYRLRKIFRSRDKSVAKYKYYSIKSIPQWLKIKKMELNLNLIMEKK